MASDRLYEAAFPFADDVLALPVEDIDRAAQWYGARFGLVEVERRDDPVPTVNPGGGTACESASPVNRGDPRQRGRRHPGDRHPESPRRAGGQRRPRTANWRVDERDGEKYQVFFVVAPDGLCYYFHQPIGPAGQ